MQEINKETNELFAQAGEKGATITRYEAYEYAQKDKYKMHREIDTMDKYLDIVKQEYLFTKEK